MSKVTYHLMIGGRPAFIEQKLTEAGIPRCIRCDRRVPTTYRILDGEGTRDRKHLGRFCTDNCAMRWAHEAINRMPSARLWDRGHR